MSLLTPDVCVVGGGSAGLVVAAGAAQLGLDVVLIERGLMGGDPEADSIAISLLTAAGLTAIFAPLTVRLYRKA